MITDVSDQFDCIKAEKKHRNVLILRKLSNPVKRLDGKKARYELEHRWLSDDSVHSVQGNDFTFWMKKEINFKDLLFEQFACIG